MRILYWTQHYWPSIGGVEVLATDFIRAMRRRGFDFIVVTSHGNHDLPDESVHDDVPIYRFPFLAALQSRDLDALVRASRAVARLKQRVRPQVVHLQFSDPSALFHLRSARAHPVPALLSVRVAPPAAAGAASLFGALLSHALWITANSQAVADDLARLQPDVRRRCSVIHEGVRPPALLPAPLSFNPPTLLCLGRVVVEKGFDLAIAALPRVLAAVPSTRLVIAGDGPARPDLERQVAALGLRDAVQFVGWIPPAEVAALINRSTLVIVPSRWREAFGQVALQAALLARPVVASDAGGLPEVVEHEGSGLIVPREDATALAGAMLRLLHDRPLAYTLGEQARMRARERFSWDHQLDAYEALYRRLAAGGDRVTP